ncbi:MAG TPA: DUF4389 domain-containing protein [Streptosporangiaceae bacterium]|nr:DUF4389 domain-containing protein [Streptosporangiaceae bacterium]
MSAEAYPVRVEASLDPRLSRWLWLVKWFLAIPHYVILAFLWMAFAVLSIAAFFAILFTGKYPRSIFDFNVGVLRWTWRVQYYTYGALGTDRYPPFSLDELPDYPAHLEIEYPARLSRGLVLVKWWLLAIPQYIIVGLFVDGGTWAAWRLGSHDFNWAGGGLIGILVLVAAIVLLVTGRYPRPIFDFVLGLNRWVLRVAAYAGLMTDKYPPFRLDMGGAEPAGRFSVPPSGPGAGSGSAAGLATEEGEPGPQAQPPGPPPPAAATGWTPGRIASVVVGSVLALASVGLLTGGATLLWAGQTQRQDGYLTSAATTYSTNGYALATDTIGLRSGSWDWVGPLVGKVRIHVTAPGTAGPVFVGIAPAAAATRYLSGVAYTTVTGLGGNAAATTSHLGSATPAAPQAARIWTAQVSGTGTQTLTWTARSGDWMVVVMNRDATAGLTVRADAGVTLPALPWIAGGLLAGGVLLAAGGVLLIVLPVRRAQA